MRKRVVSITIALLMFLAVVPSFIFAGSSSIKNVVPDKPSAISQGATEVMIKWSGIGQADGYILYKYNSYSKKYVKLATVKADKKRSFIDKNLKPGKKYYYKVRAYQTRNSARVYSKYSATRSYLSRVMPTKIWAYQHSRAATTLKWNSVQGASAYQIFKATSKKGKYTRIKTLKASLGTSYTVKNLKEGKTYYYKVRVYQKVKGKKIYAKHSNIRSKKIVYFPKLTCQIVTPLGRTNTISLKIKNTGKKPLHIFRQVYNEGGTISGYRKSEVTIKSNKIVTLTYSLKDQTVLTEEDYVICPITYDNNGYKIGVYKSGKLTFAGPANEYQHDYPDFEDWDDWN